MKKVKLVDSDDLRPYLANADLIMGEYDKDDIIFIATALFLNNCIIWSDDSDFEKQNRIPILKSKDLYSRNFY